VGSVRSVAHFNREGGHPAGRPAGLTDLTDLTDEDADRRQTTRRSMRAFGAFPKFTSSPTLSPVAWR
jgi:hypothetical protein